MLLSIDWKCNDILTIVAIFRIFSFSFCILSRLSLRRCACNCIRSHLSVFHVVMHESIINLSSFIEVEIKFEVLKITEQRQNLLIRLLIISIEISQMMMIGIARLVRGDLDRRRCDESIDCLQKLRACFSKVPTPRTYRTINSRIYLESAHQLALLRCRRVIPSPLVRTQVNVMTHISAQWTMSFTLLMATATNCRECLTRLCASQAYRIWTARLTMSLFAAHKANNSLSRSRASHSDMAEFIAISTPETLVILHEGSLAIGRDDFPVVWIA